VVILLGKAKAKPLIPFWVKGFLLLFKGISQVRIFILYFQYWVPSPGTEVQFDRYSSDGPKDVIIPKRLGGYPVTLITFKAYSLRFICCGDLIIPKESMLLYFCWTFSVVSERPRSGAQCVWQDKNVANGS